MVEVMVASVIFVISAAGIFATMSLTRKPTVQVDSKLQAALFGKKILDSLSKSVSPSGYADGGALSKVPTPHHVVNMEDVDSSHEFSGYNATYDVSDDSTGALKVTVNVQWNG